MKIDEHIKQLKQLRPFHNGTYGASVNFAIDTIHKYKQIEEIIKDHDNYRLHEDYWYIDKIREVIEDGKID